MSWLTEKVGIQKKTELLYKQSVFIVCSKRDSNSHGHFCPKDFKSFVSTIPPFERPRAENETRTRDPNLGKVVLYQLSYFRLIKKYQNGEEEETRTPTTQLSLPPQSSASTNSATSPTFRCHFEHQCPRQDSNLHVVKHTHLKRARLPIPPLGLKTHILI